MKYDLTNIAAMFLNHELEESVRTELIKHCSEAVRYPSKPVQRLVAQVAQECLEQPACTPEVTIRIGLMYGMALGILCEQDRAAREDRRAV